MKNREKFKNEIKSALETGSTVTVARSFLHFGLMKNTKNPKSIGPKSPLIRLLGFVTTRTKSGI